MRKVETSLERWKASVRNGRAVGVGASTGEAASIGTGGRRRLAKQQLLELPLGARAPGGRHGARLGGDKAGPGAGAVAVAFLAALMADGPERQEVSRPDQLLWAVGRQHGNHLRGALLSRSTGGGDA